MTEKPIEQMIQELYTVILGVPDTGEQGMATLVYQIEKHLRTLNGEVRANTTWRKAICWTLGLLIPLVGVLAGLIITKVM